MKKLPVVIAISFLAASGIACAGTAQAADTIYVKDYGTNVQAAVNAAAGKTLVFPDNVTYTISKPITPPSNITIEGHGSTLQTPKNSTTSTSQMDTIVLIKNQSNVTLSNLVFDGNSKNQRKWSEQRYEIRIEQSSSNVKIEGSTFKNLIGDGVYMGGNSPTFPSNIEISNNTFTGDHTNRNGVSVIAGNTVNITSNKFYSMGRTNMPGAVDVEPNVSSDVLKDVSISGNTVVGGPRVTDKYQYAITYNNHADAFADNVRIVDNDISGQFYTGAGVIFINQPTPSRGTNLTASGNKIHDLTLDKSNGLELDYGVHASVINNQVTNVGWGVQSWKACLTDSSGNIFNNTPNGGVVVSESTC